MLKKMQGRSNSHRKFCKWFEPRSHIIRWWSMIVQASAVQRRTVCDEIDWCFDNLSETPHHHQSRVMMTSLTWLDLTWLWWRLSLRLSKRHPMSSQTVLLRATLTQTITLPPTEVGSFLWILPNISVTTETTFNTLWLAFLALVKFSYD